ncbi:MAG TPA: branched-chain amino acid ABC transporter substrate-binding protein [Solirubrobacter sp.]|nr:branched-chain amino acid ABC transporter substrate-binding protein [Solirubrobacter sp.]
MNRAGRVAVALVATAIVAGCGGKDKQDKSELKGTMTFGVLAPVGREGELGARAKDLTNGAKLAVAEINERGGLLGRRLALDVTDDGCSAPVAYEAAKEYVSPGDVAGVIGGMCDEAAEREVSVIGSSGLPFLVTGATADGIVGDDTAAAFAMNGTVHQQALSAVFWMSYQSAQRLAVVQDGTPESQDLARQAVALIDQAPKLVSRQTAGQAVAAAAGKVLASKPDFVLWTGGAASGGELVKALRAHGYKGTFSATAASESREFLDAAGPAAEGAFVLATASPLNVAKAPPWRKRFEQEYRHAPGFDAQQGYDAVRTLAHAIQKSRTTDGAKVAEEIIAQDTDLVNSLGAMRFARDHTLLYDNRVILKVKDGAFAWERSLRTDTLG